MSTHPVATRSRQSSVKGSRASGRARKDATPSQEVSAEKIRASEAAIREYNAALDAQNDRINSDAMRVIHRLSPTTTKPDRRVEESVRQFVVRLGVHDALDAASITVCKFYEMHEIKPMSSAFRYFCGICWSKLREANGED